MPTTLLTGLKAELDKRHLDLLGRFCSSSFGQGRHHDKGVVAALKVPELMFQCRFMKNSLLYWPMIYGSVRNRTNNAGRINLPNEPSQRFNEGLC